MTKLVKTYSRRTTKWSNGSGFNSMAIAIHNYRNGYMNTVQIEKLMNVPPRTLRRYIILSKDPKSPFYMKETNHEQLSTILMDAGKKILESEELFDNILLDPTMLDL